MEATARAAEAVRTERSRSTQRRSRMAMIEERWFYVFIAPWIVGFLWFTAFPMLLSLLLSFTNYNGVAFPSWIGMQNYIQIVHDRLFWKALFVTAYYAVLAIPTSIALSLMVATLMNVKIGLMRVLRTLYYLPLVVPAVATALLWGWLLNPQFGLINYALYLVFHIQGPAWTLSRTWVVPAIVLTSLWTIGGQIVIYLAGLQGIPSELYEAAAIDGASRFRCFVHVTLPMLTPVIFFTLIMNMIGVFQVFTIPEIMTQGGPSYASLFYNLYLYMNAFQFFRLGYASALAWIQFLIVMGLTYLLLRTARSWVYYEMA